MTQWQQGWDSEDTGRWTHQCIPHIKDWTERTFGELTQFTTQMLSGHGDFQKFLFAIKKADSDTCTLCKSAATDTVQHTILKCSRLAAERVGIHAGTLPDLVSEMMRSEESWNYITRKKSGASSKRSGTYKQRQVTTSPSPRDQHSKPSEG